MTKYTLPVATENILGGVKIGQGIDVTQDGVISIHEYSNINTTIQELTNSVKDGKSLIAEAITEKNVPTSADATFKTMANKVKNINNIEVDSELSNTSENPVQNKVITNELELMNKKINNIISFISPQVTIPTMTSNTEPSGICSCSSFFNGNFDAWNAFNNSRADINTGQGGWLASENDVAPWLQYQFPQEIIPQSLSIEVCNNSTSVTRNIYVSGSKDGIIWDNILDGKDYLEITFTKFEYTTLSANLIQNNAYKFFRLSCEEQMYGGVGLYACIFSRVQIYGKAYL